jgi:hypothetical protein
LNRHARHSNGAGRSRIQNRLHQERFAGRGTTVVIHENPCAAFTGDTSLIQSDDFLHEIAHRHNKDKLKFFYPEAAVFSSCF